MRSRQSLFRFTALVAVTSMTVGSLLPVPLYAQPAPPPGAPGPGDMQNTVDPPARVGRLARVNGTVSFHTQGDTEWSAAMLNYPVTVGDAFWTQPNSEADIEVSATSFAMNGQTELDVTALDNANLTVTLPQGEIYVRVRSLAPGESYTVQTPRGIVAIGAPGRYGVLAGDTQDPTIVTVLEGAARVTGENLDVQVAAGQAATINGTDTFQGSVGPGQPDAFIQAMLSRERPPPRQSVAPPPAVAQMPGGEDLSNYGSWTQTQGYGDVWYPQVDPGWVPYREGHWAYVQPWGWTWIDAAPWGFTPFHYGRWVDVDNRWGWVPGTEVEQPVYAPALVTFFGAAAAVGVGVGLGYAVGAAIGGNVGWCPLGPGEAYRPWYRTSPGYVRNVNVGHVTNITTINNTNINNVTINNYRNRGAFTAIPASAMAGSRPVAQVAQRLSPQQMGQIRPVFGRDPVRPTATTAGVTPAVANRMHLAGQPPGVAGPGRPNAPGPVIRAQAPAVGLGAHPPLAGPGGRAPEPNAPNGRTPPLMAPGNRPPEPGNPATGRPAEPGRPNNGPAGAGAPSLRAPGNGAPPPINREAAPGPNEAHPNAIHPGAVAPGGGQPPAAVGPAARPGEPARPDAPPAAGAPTLRAPGNGAPPPINREAAPGPNEAHPNAIHPGAVAPGGGQPPAVAGPAARPPEPTRPEGPSAGGAPALRGPNGAAAPTVREPPPGVTRPNAPMAITPAQPQIEHPTAPAQPHLAAPPPNVAHPAAPIEAPHPPAAVSHPAPPPAVVQHAAPPPAPHPAAPPPAPHPAAPPPAPHPAAPPPAPRPAPPPPAPRPAAPPPAPHPAAPPPAPHPAPPPPAPHPAPPPAAHPAPAPAPHGQPKRPGEQ